MLFFLIASSESIHFALSEQYQVAGRRLKAAIAARVAGNASALGISEEACPAPCDADGVTVAIAGLANSYTDYVTTFEEYQGQRYEAASTIFGPYTHMVSS